MLTIMILTITMVTIMILTITMVTIKSQGFPEMESSSQFTAADFVRSVNKKVRIIGIIVVVIVVVVIVVVVVVIITSSIWSCSRFFTLSLFWSCKDLILESRSWYSFFIPNSLSNSQYLVTGSIPGAAELHKAKVEGDCFLNSHSFCPIKSWDTQQTYSMYALSFNDIALSKSKISGKAYLVSGTQIALKYVENFPKRLFKINQRVCWNKKYFCFKKLLNNFCSFSTQSKMVSGKSD